MGDKPAFATHQSRNGLTQPGWCSLRSLHEHSSAMTFRNRTIKGMAWRRAAELQPRQTVTVLRVNNGQEVLVEMTTTPLATTLGPTSH